MQTAEAAKHAPFSQNLAGGVALGQKPFVQRGPDYPPTMTGRRVRPVALGWTARYGVDDEDDYDADLQTALAASVTEQHVKQATDPTHLDGVVPGKGVCPAHVPANTLTMF